jgi:transcriptional regulator with XRE-family HTH domain
MEATEILELARVRSLAESGAARSIRLAADVSLSEVGAAIGAAPSTVWRWEQGQRTPRGEAGLRYARLLDSLMNRRPR